MRDYNKRGISPVIATVLLLLLTVGAVALIATFLVPFVRDNLQSSTECVSYREYLQFDESFGYNCFDSNENYAVSVKAASAQKTVSDKVIGLEVIFLGEGTSKKESIRRGSACATDLRMFGAQENCTFKVPSPGEIMTYVYKGDAYYQKVEVYPVINSEKGERICDKSGEIKLAACKIGVFVK